MPETDKTEESGHPVASLGFKADDTRNPATAPKSVVFPDDNNVLYTDGSNKSVRDEEQGEALLGDTRQKLGRRKKTQRPAVETQDSPWRCLQFLHSPENIAAVCLGAVVAALLITISIVYAAGGFEAPTSHVQHPVVKAKTSPFGSAHADHSGPAKVSTIVQKAVHQAAASAAAPAPTAPSPTAEPTIPIPKVVGRKARDKVVLKDLDSVEDDELDEEAVRRQTSTGDAVPDTYAGYVTVDPDRGSQMFFWMAEARDGNRDAPVIVYLMGGPGAPSSAFMVKSVGPREVNADAAYELYQRSNAHSWNEHYALVFIDQPIGIGFSFTEKTDGYARTDEQVASHVSAGIPTILHRFGKMDNALYIFGTSYGGKIAPFVAEGLMVDQEDKSKSFTLNLKGVAIGSGWTDPLSIVQSYGDFFFNKGYISSALRDDVEGDIKVAASLLKEHKTCQVMKYLVEDGVILSKIRESTAILNWYNLREGFDPASYFHDLTAAIKFVDAISSLLPVGGHQLEIANGGVNFTAYDYLSCAIGHSSKSQVDALLRRGIRVLVYGGEDDAMVPADSTTAWLKTLTSEPALEWKKQTKKPWSVDGTVAGFWRTDESNLLNEVLVLRAGHMVEKDQPQVAKQMVEMFVQMD